MINKLKEKLVAFWVWLKEKIRKILIALGIIGVACAAEVQVSQIIPDIQVEGQTISFPYTDINLGENLIIKTDKENYYPIWGNSADVYVAVKNNSGESQISDIQFYFPRQSITVKSVKKMVSGTYEVSVVDEVASTTKKEARTGNVWEELPISKFVPIKEKALLSDKGKDDQIADKKAQDLIAKDKITYYKVSIELPARISKEEFFIEVVGGNKGYGLLDPAFFTDNFNAYADGDLNGNGGWAGDTDFDVQSVTAYEGKAIKVIDPSAVKGITKTFGASEDITQYWYMRAAQTNKRFDFAWQDAGSNNILIVIMRDTGNIDVRRGDCAGGIAWTTMQAYNADTWYRVKLETRDVDNKFQITIDDGAASGWLCGMYDRDPGTIALHMPQTQGGGGTYYFDYYAASPYTPAVTKIYPSYYIVE